VIIYIAYKSQRRIRAHTCSKCNRDSRISRAFCFISGD